MRWASLILFLTLMPLLQAVEWRPVSAPEMASKDSTVEKGAGAEVLFWEQHVSDDHGHTVITQYIREKLFTEQGAKTRAEVSIEYGRHEKVGDIAGRTIKPDGSIVELGKDAIIDRVLAKRGSRKFQSKSFVMPAALPGSIIEYQWKQDYFDQLANYLELPLQLDVPAQEITYYIKPLADFPMQAVFFNCPRLPFESVKSGYYRLIYRNVSAYRDEPEMLPEKETHAWMFIFYQGADAYAGSTYWAVVSKKLYQETNSKMRSTREVKELAESLTAGAAADEEKLDRLLRFCRKSLINLASEDTELEERESAKRNHTAADTLRQGRGVPSDIAMAFGALAKAAGFDARWCRMADKEKMFFHQGVANLYLLGAYGVAVKVGGTWRFYDPANGYLPGGALRWQEEGEEALIADPDDPLFVNTPVTPAEQSQHTRIGQFRLDEKGTLEGDVREILSGHQAENWRNLIARQTPAEREETLRQRIKERLKDPEITRIGFTFPDDPAKPVGVTYHLKIQGYAERTGKRLFLQPAFFQVGKPARFIQNTRTSTTWFHYPWSELDIVDIHLPPGFNLDHGDAPPALNFAPAGSYLTHISFDAEKKVILYRRSFAFGQDGTLQFSQERYAKLKQIFDSVHTGDSHTLILKADAQAATASEVR